MSGAVELDADRQAFSTLAAEAARAGWQLWRSHPGECPVVYFASRWGQVRQLDDLGDVRRFLAKVAAL